jgi:flagellar basal-body rod protein FlgB
VNALDYHVERHNLITANIANADTPGYRPREMTFSDHVGEVGGQLAVQRTAEGHIPTGGDAGESGFSVHEETWATPGNDGNYVRLEHEMSRLSANSVRYRASTQMVTHHLGMIRYAIAGRR